jgi:hypothetical protein
VRARRGALQGWTDYAIYRTPEGRWMLLARGTVRELEAEGVSGFPSPSLRSGRE